MTAWLEGRVEHVLWAAQDGGWAVVRLRLADATSTVAVGPLGAVARAADDAPFVSLEGDWVDHPTHGRQFKADAVLVGAPRTEDGLRLYLGSSGVRGIGPEMANRIVRHFGMDTIGVLEREPARLAEVPGIGPARAAAVSEAWRADAGDRALTILLRGLGLSGRLVSRVAERYGDEAYAVVTGQPYRLAEEVSGIGFTLADRLARAQGLPADHPDRVAAAVRHVVARARDDGHTYLPVAEITARAARLDVPTDALHDVVDRLVGEGRLVVVDAVEEDAVALPRLDAAEDLVAAQLRMRLEGHTPTPPDADDLDEAERWAGIRLDPSQRDAVALAASAPVSVITGGPGTGKTTLVRVLLRVAAERGERFALASPTGRAAKRLHEATGHEASTLHRLLGFQPGGGGFSVNAMDPLDVDVLLVDEASMVDTPLMAAVMEALPWDRPCRLVLVGDADQLPSVGPGQVLRDLVDGGGVPVARLATVHRQGPRSGIVTAAAAVHAGHVPASGEASGAQDFFLVARDDPDAVVRTLLEVVTRRLPVNGFDPMRDVQVLTPTRKGPLGTGALNDALRDALNPTPAALTHRGRRFGVGDRVLCSKNRYDHGVFNGDLGEILAVSPSTLTIRFDAGDIAWAREEIDQIELAYAVTVHKSQGSEYPAVVLVLHRQHGILLRRNLVYTALTRAQRFFCGIGQTYAWRRAVGRHGGDERWTALDARLRRLGS